jgi:SpoVK/Ycf46/Vps4 family AAA+-type ATPase
MYNNTLYTLCIAYNGNPIYLYINSDNVLFLYYNDIEWSFINKISDLLKKYIKEEEEKMNPTDTSAKKLSKILVPVFNKDVIEYKSLGTISDKKTFDTLFYTDKAELMELVNRFKTKMMYPQHIPMDNKLGILLYGPPGTGKTGTISAIANMLERDVVLINFTEITTKKELDKILDYNQYNNNIYVFDEIDFILDALDKELLIENKVDYQSLLLVSEGEERKQILEMAKSNRNSKSDKIDMVYLLQKLDGIESGENRCIIATTNNPQKLNPALIRPGRFDIKLCLSYCTSQMCKDILSNYYNHNKDNDEIEEKISVFDFPENKYSPLQLLNMAMSHKSLDSLLDKIFSENITYEVL